VKVRSVRPRLRALALLPVLALAAVTLSACDSKAGDAAEVDGSRISESTVNSYLTPNAQAVTSSDGSSTPARQFVMTIVTRNLVLERLLEVSGGAPTEKQLADAKSAALTISEAELQANIIKSGFTSKFTDQYVQQLELQQIAGTRFTTAADLNAALAKAKLAVSVSPRYGVWDMATLSVDGLTSKNLPNMLTLDTPLPGDASATPAAQ
jgi:hypothetical protein